MRTSRTFVVRLLADSDEPQALRGLVHSVGSGEEHPFAGEEGLLALLRRMVAEAVVPYHRGTEDTEKPGFCNEGGKG